MTNIEEDKEKMEDDEDQSEGEKFIVVRNQKYKEPPTIHSHALRNPF